MTIWTHRDPSIMISLEWAHARCRDGDWLSGTPSERMDHFRALLAETASAIGWFVGSRFVEPSEVGSKLFVNLDVSALATGAANRSPERYAVASSLYETFVTLRDGDPGVESDFETRAHADTSALLPIVAIVSVSIAGAAAIAYCAYHAATIIDRQLSRGESSKRLMASHVALLEILNAHQKREESAGKMLPLDAASKAAITGLQQQNSSISSENPYPTMIPNSVSSVGMTSASVIVAILAGLIAVDSFL